MKKYLSGLILACFFNSLYAVPMAFNLSSYYIPITYSQSDTKVDQEVYGVYGFWGLGASHSLEVEYDTLYPLNEITALQYDYTAKYTYYTQSGARLWAGYHFINPSGSSSTGEGQVTMVGFEKDRYDYYGVKLGTVGIELYSSHHNTVSGNVSVVQVTPKWTQLVYAPFGFTGTLSLETKANVGFLSKERGFNATEFLFLEENIAYYSYPFVYTLNLWSGSHQFGVQNQGVVVYNLQEEYHHGFGGFLGYYFNPVVLGRVGYQHTSFRELDRDSDTLSNKWIWLISFSF